MWTTQLFLYPVAAISSLLINGRTLAQSLVTGSKLEVSLMPKSTASAAYVVSMGA